MQTNIIEISKENREISAHRGFMHIKEHGTLLAEIPLDSICAVMSTGHAVIYTNSLLRNLCEAGVPLIIIGNNYIPVGILTPLIGNTQQMEIQQIQINSSKPLTKQLWKTIVQEKIRNQSRVLDKYFLQNKIRHLPSSVLSGDINNIEGIAARMYFPALFGSDFIRNHSFPGINSFLNYGYAILRGAIARLVIAAGLNPSYGIQHHNKLNPLCLVDDLMEPYRPLIDDIVYNLLLKSAIVQELTTENKRQLAGILETQFKTRNGISPLINIMQRDIWNFVNSLKCKQNKLDYENII